MSGVVDVVSVVGPFQCNCHVIICPETRHTALIDPGDEPGKILELLRKQEAKLGGPLAVTHLFHTHAHLDHTGRLPKLMKAGFTGKIYATPRYCLLPFSRYPNSSPALSASPSASTRNKPPMSSAILPATVADSLPCWRLIRS
jgi:glyoxylase-like metal-dependent hydrolase (beta-lactamase superfamily II)